MYKVVTYRSRSGKTVFVQTINLGEINPKSLAAAILLKNELMKGQIDNDQSWVARIEFSRNYLRKLRDKEGILKCSYCPKEGLIIEEEGMKVPNYIKATIDHIVPIAHGGGLFDEDNVCCACGTCNTKKADKSVDEFIKYKNQQK